jgi:multidrug efflux pump subunit AcrA (membrane-fusion protein)
MNGAAGFPISRPVLWVLIAAIIFAAGAWLFRPKAVAVQWAVVENRDALETVLANGRIAGSKVVPLSFMKNGIIARIAVREGAAVTMGETLAVLDNREEQSMVAQRQMAVRTAEINLSKASTTDQAQAQEAVNQARLSEDAAQKQLSRQKALFDQGALARAELDKVQQAYDLAVSQRRAAQTNLAALGGTQTQLLQTQVAQARAMLDDARIALFRSALMAPENGMVVKIYHNKGELVPPGTVVCEFLPADTTTHVELLVDEDAVGRIKVGQRAKVTVPGSPDAVFDATVRDIVPFVDASRGTVTVQLALAGNAGQALPDQTVSAEIITATVPNSLIVQQRFVRFARPGDEIFVKQGPRAGRRTIAARELGNGDVLVDSGLNAGDTVVLAAGLVDGARVKLARK